MHGPRLVRTGSHAEATAGTDLFVDVGDGWLLHHLPLGEELQHLGRRSTGLSDGLRDVLGKLARPGQENARREALHRPQFGVSLAEETVLVNRDAQALAQVFCSGIGHSGCGQHHQVGFHLQRRAGEGIHAPDHHLAVFLKDLGHLAPQVEDVIVLHGPLHELLVALALRADVNVENVGLALGHLLLVHDGLLGHVHAADLGAIRLMHFRVTGTGALHEDHFLGHLTI